MGKLLLAVVLAAMPLVALGQVVTYANLSGTITTGGSAQALASVNPGRHGCMVQNQSTTDLWVSDIGTAAATQPSVKIPAGAQYLCMTPAPTGTLSIFGATTAQAFAAREW